MKWRDDDSLWFAGWSGLGSVYGVIRLDGNVDWMTREDAIVGTNSSAPITTAPDKKVFAAVRESMGAAGGRLSAHEASAWSPVSQAERRRRQGLPAYPEVRAIAWKGVEGLDPGPAPAAARAAPARGRSS